ncbi:MAG: efflux RND transporter permease subunit, partial [Rudaea sp.]
MYAFGFSINNMTLLALTLSVGFVVDDAIVMLENIVRHIEGGMRPFEAALKGAREIGFTIVSITFSLIAVFIPVLLMGGIVGRVFREFAVTIAVAIILSGFVSLTLTPMLCARVLHGHHDGEKKQAIILRIFERLFQLWLKSYEWALDRVLAFKSITLLITLATIGGTIWLYIVVPKGFFPIEDTGYVLAITEAQSDTSFNSMVERQRKMAEIIRADKAVLYVNSTVGVGGPNPTANQGRMLVALKPKSERGPLSAVLQRFRRDTGNITGMAIFFQTIQNINVGGKIQKSQYQYTLQSSDSQTLYRLAPDLREKISKLQGLQDVTTDLYVTNPQVTIDVDREKAAVYGVTIDQIRQELFDAFGTRQVATIYTPSNDYMVILETKPEFRSDPSNLGNIFVKTNGPGNVVSAPGTTAGGGVTGNGIPSGQSIPLTAVTKPVASVGPLLVNHQGQQPAVTISFNLAPGYSLGDAVTAIQKLERDFNLPATITTGFQGTAQVFQESLKGQGILILAAIFAAYVVLGILYESFIHPITIISGLPSAGIGALLTLILFR